MKARTAARFSSLAMFALGAALALAESVRAAKPERSAATAPTAAASPIASPGATLGPAQKIGGKTVVLAVIDGAINPATLDYLRDAIAVARERDAQALVVQLDTPGGLLSSAQDIVQEFLASPVPVVVFVAPSGGGAISAGVFITMAAHVAVMAPSTNIGAAHPVGGQGEDIGGDMREKVENTVASLSRTVAEKRGRNAAWAEKAVRESVSITESEAVKERVVDFVAKDMADLLGQLNGRRVELENRAVELATAGVEVHRHEMSWRQVLLDVLGNPQIAYLLMMAGMLGLYVEFTHPGLFFPGIAGALCLLLSFAALQVLPINYAGLGLILLGIGLLVAEVFVPSFGILGIGGAIAFVIGSLLLFDTPDMTLRLSHSLVFGTAAAFASFTLVATFLVARAQSRPVVTGGEAMVGTIGEVRSVEDGRVKIMVRGEYWNAEGPVGMAVGDKVEVTAISGLTLTVKPKS